MSSVKSEAAAAAAAAVRSSGAEISDAARRGERPGVAREEWTLPTSTKMRKTGVLEIPREISCHLKFRAQHTLGEMDSGQAGLRRVLRCRYLWVRKCVAAQQKSARFHALPYP